ncbi:DNA-binding protein [Photobacterium sp. ZSDE20]|uniref:DNA-binding protein n=1 Tax=Photobacterium pectinilyticum TaxID=2906793 RepID=A0ABT1NAW7_9GAMM|nr:DNA-binding protein [Photobacterium sp. ZSDE20]MCQ1060459.1 DNA-binding protein [Photobacterium sp. ZSDE20]MDD1826209.1 DNA-binding protein [Photobacterium sp. ZSDE20]
MDNKLVTKERVFEICDQLAAVGEKVTNVAVRTELGGGSMSEIAPLLKEWKGIVKSSALAQSDIDIPPLPTDELAEYLAPWWRQMWKTIYFQANTKIAEVKNQAEEEVALGNAKIAEQAEEINQQQGLIDNLTVELHDYHQQQSEFDQIVKENHGLKHDLQASGYQADLIQQRLEAREQDIKRLNDELHDALASLQSLRTASNDELNELRKAHRDDVQEIHKQVNFDKKEASSQIEQLQQDINQAQLKIGQLQADNTNMSSQVASLLPLDGKNRILAEEKNTLLLKLEEVERALDSESKLNVSLKQKLDAIQSDLSSADRNLARAETELEQTQLQAENLKEHCKELEQLLRSESATVNRFNAIIEHDADTITELRNENSRLTKRVDQLIDTVANVSSK